MSRTTIGWGLAAIAGLLLAAGLTLAVSELTSQHAGLYEESPTAGSELVVRTPPPATTAPKAEPARPKRTTTPAPAPTTPAPPATATTPPPATTTDDNSGSGSDDDGSGRGRGRGRSGGSDDD